MTTQPPIHRRAYTAFKQSIISMHGKELSPLTGKYRVDEHHDHTATDPEKSIYGVQTSEQLDSMHGIVLSSLVGKYRRGEHHKHAATDPEKGLHGVQTSEQLDARERAVITH